MHHDTASRPDLLIQVYWSPGVEAAEGEVVADTVIVESKIGSREGPEQLRRYAEHLEGMADVDGKVLLYVTRDYDPKDPGEILSGLVDNVRFEQVRRHDFYRFLQTVKKDALIEEVMLFMEEQGMAKSYRFSATDLIALSSVPRVFEIFDETLGGEVKAKLESFAGNRVRRETHGLNHIRWHRRYITIASLHEWDLFCFIGYTMRTPNDYPVAHVNLELRPEAMGRGASITVMKRIVGHNGWEGYNLDDPTAWSGVTRSRGLADFLPEGDHVAAVKRFFVESLRQLREELAAFKEERPDLPWAGG